MVCKGKNGFFASCRCGCDNSMIVKVLDDVVFITFGSSKFSTEQKGLNRFIYEAQLKSKEIFCILKKKKFWLSDIILDLEDKEDFLDAINSIEVKNGSPSIKDNTSIFEIEIDEEFNIFSLYLLNKTSLKDAFLNKTYRAYDIALNKQQWEGFVKYCNKKLS